MSLSPDQEQRRTRAWTVAGTLLVATTLVLAGMGMILALRQMGSMAFTRIADRRLEARAIKESIVAEAQTTLSVFFDHLGSNFRPPKFANALKGLDTPSWTNEVYYAVFAPEMLFERWRRDADGHWEWVDNKKEKLGPHETAMIGRLFQQYMSATFATRQRSVQFVYDVENENPVVIAVATQMFETPALLAVDIDLPAFQRDMVLPRLPADRFAFSVVLPEQASAMRRAGPWEEDLGPIAPFLWLTPTKTFVEQQNSIVRRQTILFVAGTVLAMAALLGVMWSMWRVFKRELALSQLQQAFVADVSHELKTPLALIRLFAETLMSGRVPSEDKRQEYYTIIARESDRLTHMINNILDFARIDAGRKRYTFQRCDVADIVRETYEAYGVQLDHEGFEHQLVIGDNLPPVDCDRDAIAQALINLINNAMKYNDGADKFLGIDLSRETRRGRHGVLISVSDRGIGIRPEDRNQLFTGFYRSADERVRQKRGAGLGLALVKHIVDAHGGIVDVESRLVKGSTFRIFLPASLGNTLSEDADHATSNSDRGR